MAIEVQPRYVYVQWTGSNLAEFQQYTNASVNADGTLTWGPSMGPLPVGQGVVFRLGGSAAGEWFGNLYEALYQWELISAP